jgi:hypothetical protein
LAPTLPFRSSMFSRTCWKAAATKTKRCSTRRARVCRFAYGLKIPLSASSWSCSIGTYESTHLNGNSGDTVQCYSVKFGHGALSHSKNIHGIPDKNLIR